MNKEIKKVTREKLSESEKNKLAPEKNENAERYVLFES